MDDIGEDDLSDTQFNDICENYLTASQFDEFSMSWDESVERDRKRKSSDNESPIPQKCQRVSVIAHTPNVTQLGAGRVEPEKEKNPKQENEELLEQSHQHENDSHQVEPEKEKNPQPVAAKQQDGVIRKGEKTISFKNRLFQITYEPKNGKDIFKTGVKYKPKIKGKVQEYMDRNIQFFMVYKVKLVKVNANGEEERVDAFLNSANRRVLDMDQFDEVYGQHMDKINEDFESYTGESSGWMLDELKSINLHISKYKPIRGSSYTPTPVGLASKKAIVNI